MAAGLPPPTTAPPFVAAAARATGPRPRRCSPRSAALHVHGVAGRLGGVLRRHRRAPRRPAHLRLPAPALLARRRRPAPATSPAAGLAPAGHPLLGAAVPLADAGRRRAHRPAVAAHPPLAGRPRRRSAPCCCPAPRFVELAAARRRPGRRGRVEELTLRGAAGRCPTAAASQRAGRRRRARRRPAAGRSTVHSRPATTPTAVDPARRRRARRRPHPAAGADLDRVAAGRRRAGRPRRLLRGARRAGLGYGPAFQGLRAAWRRGDEVFAEVALPEDGRGDAGGSACTRRCSTRRCTPPARRRPADAGGARLPFAWTGVRAARRRRRRAAGPARAGRARTRCALQRRRRRRRAGRRRSSRLALRAGRRRRRRPPPRDRRRAGWPVDRRAAAPPRGRRLPAPDASPTTAAVGPRRRRWCRAVPADGDPARPAPAARRTAAGALALLQAWLADDRLADARLVVVTRGAVAVAGDDVPTWRAPPSGAWCAPRRPSTPAGSCWSTSTTRADAAVAAAAAAADEPQLAVRDGAVAACPGWPARPRRRSRGRRSTGRHRADHRRHRRARRAASPGTWSPRTASGDLLLVSRRGPARRAPPSWSPSWPTLGADGHGRRLRRRRPRRARRAARRVPPSTR